MNNNITLQMLGANGRVTGSSTLVTMPNGLKILIDIGLIQDSSLNFEEVNKMNIKPFDFNISEIDYVILTHSHIDHIGNLPKLTRDSKFKGKVISTQPTAEFADINLPDSAYLNEKEVNRINRRRIKKNQLEVVYSMEEARDSIDYIRCYDFNKEIILDENTTLILKKAGHILGASCPLIKYTNNKTNKETKLLFTGDTSGKDKNTHPFIPVADNIGSVDYVQIESTYGDRVHSKVNPIDKLKESIEETCFNRRKTLVIPSFSIQRSSEILWLLREIYIKHPEYEDIPIYLDSPMSCSSQVVMNNNREYWDKGSLYRDNQLGNLFEWKQVRYIRDPKASKALSNGDTKIIIASSGMCNGGRVLHHISSFLPSKGCKILLCGYQGEGTLGNKLLNTKQKTISIEGRQCRINAKVDFFEFSSHADINQLLTFLKTSDNETLRKIVINHGNVKASKNLKKEINKQLHKQALFPQQGEIIKLKIN